MYASGLFLFVFLCLFRIDYYSRMANLDRFVSHWQPAKVSIHCKINIYFISRDGHSFSKRIINAWNSLPDCAVLSRTVKTFKFEISKLHFSDYCVNYI